MIPYISLLEDRNRLPEFSLCIYTTLCVVATDLATDIKGNWLKVFHFATLKLDNTVRSDVIMFIYIYWTLYKCKGYSLNIAHITLSCLACSGRLGQAHW